MLGDLRKRLLTLNKNVASRIKLKIKKQLFVNEEKRMYESDILRLQKLSGV